MPRTFAALLLVLAAAPARANDFTILPAGPTPPKRLLHDLLLAECRARFAARAAEVEALTTPADIAARQERLRKAFVAALGGFPEKTPLNARTVGTLTRDGYRVEKVIYESRPDHHVTANLYVPDGAGPFPGVLMPIGHSQNGKAAEYVQRGSILLVKNGFVVLAFDPIGQGERVQLLDKLGQPAVKGSTSEHTLCGVGALPTGHCTASFRVWDGIRSLDYLCARPEVDAKRIGCTGCSGGGTDTAYLMALDDRVAAAAPSCYLTSLDRLFATIGPQDGEQNLPGQVAVGLDHADYITMRAPKPTLVLAATKDFFDITGTRAAVREAGRVYGKFGVAERVELVETDTTHGYPKSHREAAVRFLNRWLRGVNEAVVEPDFPIEKDADLRCSRTGNVIEDLKGRSVFDLNAAWADECVKRRAGKAWEPAALRATVAKQIGLPGAAPAPALETIGREERDGYTVLKLLYTRPGGLPLPAVALVPAREKREGARALLVHDGGKAAVLAPGGEAERLVKAGRYVLAVDLSGWGETAPGVPTAGRPNYFGVESREVFLSLHLNRPLLGRRVQDLMAVVRHLRTPAVKDIELFGFGAACPVVLHAAALLPDDVAAVTLDRGVLSWDAVARTAASENQFAAVVPGALAVYDLPDLAASLSPRPLVIRNPTDAAGRPAAAERVTATYAPVQAAYARDGAEGRFTVHAARTNEKLETPKLETSMRLPLAAVALALVAADLPDLDPAVFPPDDPRAKALSKMVWADARKRLADAGEREAKAFAAVQTRADWEAFRNPRLAALKASLGDWPDTPANVRVEVLKSHPGDGFVIDNLVYETRPGLWVTANRYRPAAPAAKPPGVLLSHSHHSGRTSGELQDMGMTWARAGCVVLVPDHLGYGERRQHPFRTEKDHPQPYRVGRQDYFHRYVTNLQLSAVGDSLMGWMVWDLMRGVEVLLQRSGADPDRIVLLGAVAGGGDPAGVTAALDPRISCVVPFNFGGWQPESSVTANPDREFAWFGDGYWESTRGLRNGARDGFAHWVIVGGVAPRRLVHAHEFAWLPANDPAWPRLQKVFGFYGAKDHLGFAHGGGSVKGRPPESTHCDHIGAVHRKMVYPYLKAWFDMPVPAEYSQRRPSADLACWSNPADVERLKPASLRAVLSDVQERRAEELQRHLPSVRLGERVPLLRKLWADRLGPVEPRPDAPVFVGKAEAVPGAKLERFALETEPGVTVPLLLIGPDGAKGRTPVVVMVAQTGRAAFLKERANLVRAFLAAGVAVCLPDLRGTGESRVGTAADRTSSRTSLSQTEQILGRTALGNQLRDLRAVLAWLRARPGLDPGRQFVWGDSFVEPYREMAPAPVPLDLDQPRHAEPGAATLALLAALFEPSVEAAVGYGGLTGTDTLFGPAVLVPHDAVVPGFVGLADPARAVERTRGTDAYFLPGSWVDARNTARTPPRNPAAAGGLVEGLLQLRGRR